MNTRAIFAIIRKDLKVVSQNKGVMLPTLIAPLFLFVILPWSVVLLPSIFKFMGLSADDLGAVQSLIARMPAGLQQGLAGYTGIQLVIVYILVYMLAPFFLLIPLMVSAVIAADSFAGEKERKTMEALLYTPTTDRELFIAKLLSGWLAALVVAFAGFVLYVITVNAAAWSQIQQIFFPNTMWLVMIFWVVPALPGLGLGVVVIVSSRAEGFQDANQISGVLALPILLLVVGQVSGAMFFSISLVLLLGLVIWLLDGLLIWLGSRSFRRGRLLGA
ncbi:MAG: ABC transporter permease subunit [Chloroflexota bacterium]|nr:MAG: ABC transporter permease subunit [Chloroflexota bacterium]